MTQMITSMQAQATFREMLERARPSIAAVLPRHIDPGRLIKTALIATSRSPALLGCSPSSVLQSVMTAAQLGLDVGGALGSAYLVPFKGSCQLIVGYRGLIDLARRSGQISGLEARIVYEHDHFELEYGLEPRVRHRPCLDADPGAMRLVYAIALLRDGSRQIEVMTRKQIDGIRIRSRACNDGPWVTDYEEMARKTAIKRLCKYLPLSTEMATAIEADNQAEQIESDSLSLPAVDVPEEQSHADATKNRARERVRAKAQSLTDAQPLETRAPGSDDA